MYAIHSSDLKDILSAGKNYAKIAWNIIWDDLFILKLCRVRYSSVGYFNIPPIFII